MASSAETDHVIVPPPSALNPIPSLPIALRIDNKERFIELLLTPPNNLIFKYEYNWEFKIPIIVCSIVGNKNLSKVLLGEGSYTIISD